MAKANELPWGEIGVDVSSARMLSFTAQGRQKLTRCKLLKKVVISAPAGNDPAPTIAYSVNERLTADDKIISRILHNNYLAPG